MTTTTTTAAAARMAADMAWLGGITAEAKLAAAYGAEAVTEAKRLGLIEPAHPRLGAGRYVASRTALAREFGGDYVKAIDALTEA